MSAARTPARRPKRAEIPAGSVACDFCAAKCCQYIALPIDTPTEWRDFEYIRWYLAHEDISVFVDEAIWYIMVHRRCTHLQADNRCGIYHTRPTICREYSVDSCEYEDDFTYDKIFERDEQIFEYAEAVLGPQPGQPRLLPILAD